MAADKVFIEFGVETAGLNSDLDKIKANLGDVEKTAKKTTSSVKSGFGEAKGAISELSPALGSAVGGVENLGKAFKVLLLNPIFLAITALVGTFAALYQAFIYTDTGANRVKGAFSAIGASADTLKMKMGAVASGLAKFFSLDFGGAAGDFIVLGTAMTVAGGAANDYVQDLDKLTDAETAHATIAAKNALLISDLESKAVEKSKYNRIQRQNFLKDANKLIEEESAWQVAHAKDAFDAEVRNVAGRLNVTKESITKLLEAKDGERDGLIKNNKEIERITEASGGEYEIALQQKSAAVIRQQQVEIDTKRANLKKVANIDLQEDADALANKQKSDAKTEAAEKKHQEELAKIVQQHLDTKNQQLTIQSDYENAMRQKEVNDTKDVLTHKLAEIEAAAEKEINAANERNKKIQAQGNLTEEDKKKSAFTTAQAIEKINQDAATKQQELIKAEVDAKKKAEEEITKKTKEESDKRLELEKQAKIAALDTLSKASDAYFQMQANARAQEGNDIQQKYNDESAALENMKAKGMIAEGAYAAQKKALDDKYKADEKAFKIKSFEADKQAAITKIAIDTALAVVKTFVSYGGFTPAAWIAVAAQIAAGGIQAAIVESQPVPAFAKGTAYVDGAGTGTSDSITARLSRGERVVTAKKNRDYWNLYQSIDEGRINPSFANNIVKNLGVYEQISYPDYAAIDMAIARKAEANHQKAFNMAISAVMQGTDNREDLMRLNKTIKANKGVVIENIEQLADAIKPKEKRSLWN